jgi:hypothetical protein
VRFFSCSAGRRRFRRIEGEENIPEPLFFWVSSGGAWAHAPPVAMARGRTRSRSSCCHRTGPSTVVDFWMAVL